MNYNIISYTLILSELFTMWYTWLLYLLAHTWHCTLSLMWFVSCSTHVHDIVIAVMVSSAQNCHYLIMKQH